MNERASFTWWPGVEPAAEFVLLAGAAALLVVIVDDVVELVPLLIALTVLCCPNCAMAHAPTPALLLPTL